MPSPCVDWLVVNEDRATVFIQLRWKPVQNKCDRMYFNTIMQYLKRHMIGVLAELAVWCGRDKDPRLCRRSRFSLFYKLPSLSRLLVHLPLSCAHTSPLAFLPLTSYLFFFLPPPPSPIGSEWTTRPAMSSFVFSRPLSLRPSFLLPAPGPVCSCLGAAVLKWVTNTDKETQAAIRFTK